MPNSATPVHVEHHNGVGTFEADVKCLVVVAGGDPRIAGEHVTLLLAPFGLRRRNPARRPEGEVEMNDRQASPGRRARARACSFLTRPI